MSAAALLSIITGWSAGLAAPIATLLVLIWNGAIYFDSSALTAGTVQAADKELKGATPASRPACVGLSDHASMNCGSSVGTIE
jgi:hypothetical protein